MSVWQSTGNNEKREKGEKWVIHLIIVFFFWLPLENIAYALVKGRHVSVEMKSIKKEESLGPPDTLTPFNFLVFTLCPTE